MKIKLYHYTIPCRTGVVLRKQPLTERQGLIIRLEKNGKIGWGEIAPLPTFSRETLAECEAQVRQWLKKPTDLMDNFAPSVAFGISCALAELNGTLQLEGNFRSAILCDGDVAKFSAKLTACQAHLGKIKIGFNAEKEGELANLLLMQFPDLQLRLDANRAFSLEQAVKFAEKIAKPLRSHIQFIEEPCQTPALSRQFAEMTGIHIAWDESVREPHFLVKDEPNLTAIVIKPTLTGSLEKCVSLIQQAHSQGISVVISSSIESSLGLTQLACIAKQYTPDMVAGLDTLHLMQWQLLRQWQGSDLPLIDENSEFLSLILESED